MPPGLAAATRTSAWQGRLDLILPVGMIASVLVILVPLPPALLDLLLSANIAIAVVMLLTAIYVKTPLEFSIFPTLLLATTLARLVLNVATTRLILTKADVDGLNAAGGVVRSFGEFVAGDRVVVGLVVFSIIVLIQFVVITKGATRISEVAARFALDGMPGRQMAIDADLQAGVINDQEARRRREEVTRQADFFSAMDGASKFVRGDAVAGLAITFVNVLGGLFIGTMEAGMSMTEAGGLFTRLTIGDGLVSQVPAFLISIAAGILITRSTASTNLPAEFVKQLFSRPQALAVAGGFLCVLIFTSLPTIPLMVLGGGCVGLAAMLNKQEQRQQAGQSVQAEAAHPKTPEQRVEDSLHVDPLEIEVGLNLVRLADGQRGGDLLSRVQHVRQRIAAELGIVMPKVRILDNFALDRDSYRIKFAGMPLAEARLLPGLLLAVASPQAQRGLPGVPAREPAFGKEALWIEPAQREAAQALGYSVVDAAGVIATHLTELVRVKADDLLTRDAAKHLIDELKKTAPAVVEELIPKQLSLAEVQAVLKLLLREAISIRQLGMILETLGDEVPRVGKEPHALATHVRQRLKRLTASGAAL